MTKNEKSPIEDRYKRSEESTAFTLENVRPYASTLRRIAYHLGVNLFPRNDSEYAAESYAILSRKGIRLGEYEMIWKSFDAMMKDAREEDNPDAPDFIRAHFENLYFLLFYRIKWKYGGEPDAYDILDIAEKYVNGKGFERLVRNFDPEKGGWKYIYKAAQNYLHDYYRAQKHKANQLGRYLAPQKVVYHDKFRDHESFSEEAHMTNSYTETWELIEDTLLLNMTKDLLFDTLRRMSKYEYACFLRDYMNYSIDKLVKLAGCEVSTLKSAISRCRKRGIVEEYLQEAVSTLRNRVGEDEWAEIDTQMLLERALVDTVHALEKSTYNPLLR